MENTEVFVDKQIGDFGKRIRERRNGLNLSLRALGKQAGLSASFLAQVERGEANPSIISLQQIANALQVPIFYFFVDESKTGKRVVHRNQRRQLNFPDANVTYELLLPGLDYKSMGIIIRLGPGERIDPIRLSEETEEWLYLLRGEIEIQLTGEIHCLKQGDSIGYESWELEGVVSTSEEESVLVGNMTPPAF